ncbi:MAG TPA: hypothetical protein VMY42_00980 [Thermoguttaceae bacterium]|nr:hypothetical protein [Thermoguttaceae bacterium]
MPPFTDWTISRDLWATLRPRLRPGLSTLETGSGLSTLLFDAAGCRHTALEHNPKFAAPSRSVVRVDLVGDPRWYDWTPTRRYDLILIDGPPKDVAPRDGIDRVLADCLNHETTILLDDTHRPGEHALAERIAADHGYTPLFHGNDKRGFALLEKPRRPTRWAVGITTAPRPRPTLERTMQALTDAGWDRYSIFAEPGAPLPLVDPDRIRVYRRPATLDIWQNWITGLADLLAAYPEADAFFMLQDDVLLCRGLRDYLERVLWPADHRVGICSPYQPAPYLAEHPGAGFYLQNRGWYLAGALTWIIPPATARSLLPTWANFEAERQLDARIGNWCLETGRSVWYHSPSLAQHLGLGNSASGDESRHNLRRAGDFIGRDRKPSEPTP